MNQNPDVIDTTQAKSHVKQEIDHAESEIETTKRNIGSTRLEKRISAMKKQIEKLEASNPFFEELHKLKNPTEVLALLDRQLISQLPPDQKEMLSLLEGRMKDSQVPMSVDD